jgi:glucose-6-phosphate 1-epimerase
MADAGAGGVQLFHGLPSVSLRLPCGDSIRVLLHGAQVVLWTAEGRERLYLSSRSRFDGQSAVRGGVPVCFPQFNQRGSLPKHGFARNLSWQAGSVTDGDPGCAHLSLRLQDGPASRQFWPMAFEAMLTLDLCPGSLTLTLDVRNTDAVPMDFTGALHTYLAVDDVATAQLQGLDGQPEWDAVANRHARADGPLRFHGEFDRVYDAAPRPLLLLDGPWRLAVEQSASWAQTVVWNPGPDKGPALTDLPPDGYARMLCVEAAQVMRPVTVPPGGAWRGWQRLRAA